jgi:preprotein translocase subunit SecF
MLLGPDVIKSFTTALLISVVVGTYSTIYIAAPFLIWLKVDSNSFLPKTALPGSAERVEHQEGYTR